MILLKAITPTALAYLATACWLVHRSPQKLQ